MKKTLIKFICLIVVLIMCVGVMCACNKDDDFRNPRNGEPEAGKFYTLQQAYDNGWLSKGDLRNIASYYNDGKDFPEKLDVDTENRIKNAKAESLRNDEAHPILEAKAEDFKILRYYGTYDDLIVIILNDPYSEAPAVIVNYWEKIGGVKFHHTGHNYIEIIKL